MHGTGSEPFFRAGIFSLPSLKLQYQNRLREIRDLLYNPEQIGSLIDEYAAFIADPKGGLSFVDADRAKWDYHPIMASAHILPSKAGQGRFYQITPTKDFRGMVKLMKEYVTRRGQWVDNNLLPNQGLPISPIVTADGPLAFWNRELKFRASVPAGGDTRPVLEWRLAEITVDSSASPKTPCRHEINAVWESNGNLAAEIPTGLLENGHTYRVRARSKDASGQCSHWSAPAQFTVPLKP
jgi:hypothetical protein